ncbi:4-hydroxy-tetrahydrodipicolinate synthase [Marinicella sp. W31]|uniref:4-hydroxy-tetrahydrodipicolinate synthase n=1 Tax=Marinicella sp. W31 TaxID=3023713 RepID=UPI003757B1C3
MKQLTAQDLYGGMVALATPMRADGSIHYEQWDALIQWHLRSGTRALIVAGTTGESAMLSTDEFKQLIERAAKLCSGTETAIIAGTGAIQPDKSIELTHIAADSGAQAALVVTPYYIRIGQQALITHYRHIADAASIPLILYNVPSRTTLDLTASTSLKLAQHENIIGIKEAKPDMQRIQKLATHGADEFVVLSGDDDTFLNAMQVGARGVISVASNVRPQAINRICHTQLLGDAPAADKLNQELAHLYQLLFVEPNPIPVKWLLHQAGIIDNGIRAPLQWLDEPKISWKNELNKIKQEYQ